MREPLREEDEMTGKIIGAAIEVHKHLGPGLLESAYQACLAHEMTACSLQSLTKNLSALRALRG